MKRRSWPRCFLKLVGLVMMVLAIRLLAPALSLTIGRQEGSSVLASNRADALLDPVLVARNSVSIAPQHHVDLDQADPQTQLREVVAPTSKAFEEASTTAQPWFPVPDKVDTVWIDVGTAARSDFHLDLKLKKSLYLIGIEPTPHFARASRKALNGSSTRQRYNILQRACTEFSEPRSLTFYKHPEHECNSLNADNSERSQKTIAGGKCMGEPAQEIKVETVTLQEVISHVPSNLRIQLLKLDVQGHEWPCLKGGAQELSRVDNIFIEVQDLESNRAMYKGSLNVGEMDNKLGHLGFKRQYCEANNMGLREVNCLYTQQERKPLWVTGRPQKGPVTNEDLSKDPRFPTVRYVTTLWTAKTPGVLISKIQGLRLHP